MQNCLSVLRLLLETCEYLPVAFTEIYLLGMIEEIAKEAIVHDEHYKRFSSDSYIEPHSIEEQSLYLEAITIILLGARIKRSRTYKNIELKEPSMFAKAAARLEKHLKKSELLEIAQKQFLDPKGRNSKKYSEKFRKLSEHFLLNDSELGRDYEEFIRNKFQDCMVEGIGFKSKQMQKQPNSLSKFNAVPNALEEPEPLSLMKLLRFGDGHITS